MAVQPKIGARPATMADFQDVMDIDRNVLNGMDYLYAMYSWIIHSPEYMAMVLTIDDRVVGFGSTLILDGGRSAYIGSSRLLEKYRQRPDLLQVMRQHGIQALFSRFPNVRARMGISMASDRLDAYLTKYKDEVKIVYKWTVEYSRFTPEDLHRFNKQHQHQNMLTSLVRSLNLREVKAMLPAIKSVLSDGKSYFLYGAMWSPSEVTDDQILYASRMSEVIVSLGSPQSLEPVSVSMASFITLERGVLGILYYNGRSTDDCLDHIKYFYQLFSRHSWSSTCPLMYTNILVPDEVDFKTMTNSIRPYFGKAFVVPGDRLEDGGRAILTMQSY